MEAFFHWVEGTRISQYISASSVIFPAVEAVHLVALALLGGSVLVVDLRLLGLGLNAQETSVVERGARRWMIIGVCMMVLTGVMLFLAEPIKLYNSGAFAVKMGALVLAVLYAFVIRNPLARRGLAAGWQSKAVGMVSIGLWFTVAAAGRWIGWGG